MKDSINALKKQIENVRNNIESTLLDMMRCHNKTYVYCGADFIPVISRDTDTIELNSIEIWSVNGNEYILFGGCGEYGNYNIPLKSMDIEYLIGVYEWVDENQDELFDDYDE